MSRAGIKREAERAPSIARALPRGRSRLDDLADLLIRILERDAREKRRRPGSKKASR